jgi:quinol monooxygenase YgiN
MTESVVNAAFLRDRAGKEDELAGRLEVLVRASRSDAGVIIYDLRRSILNEPIDQVEAVLLHATSIS